MFGIFSDVFEALVRLFLVGAALTWIAILLGRKEADGKKQYGISDLTFRVSGFLLHPLVFSF